MNIELVGQGIPERTRVPEKFQKKSVASPKEQIREAYFGPAEGWRKARIMDRESLAQGVAGPIIIEEYDATCLVPPGAAAVLDDYGNIIIRL